MKIWKWAALALALLNIAILSFVLIHHHHEHFPPPTNGNPAEFLVRELKLTDAQQKQFDELKQTHHATIDSIQDAGKNLHHEFFSLLKSNNIDKMKVDSLASMIADNQKQMELATFNHFQQVRNICTDEQKKIFDSVIEDALRLMAAPHNPPPPGR